MDELFDWQIQGTAAEIYDEVFLQAFISEWSPRMADKVSLRPEDRVLDVACGTGSWALCAASRLGATGRAVGLDIDPDMLAVARGKDVSGVPASVEWREGSADAIPYADSSFDVVCCQLGLMFFPDQVAALREMLRILVPDGRFASMVWGRMEACPGQTAVANAWSRQFGADAANGFRRQHSLSDPNMVETMLLAAGFKEVTVTVEEGVVRFPSPGHLTRGYAALIGLQVTASVARALIADVDAALADYVGPMGLIYPIEAVIATGHT